MKIRTPKAIHKDHTLPHIIQPQSAIDAPCHDLVLSNVQAGYAVPTFLKDLDRLRWLTFVIPNPNCRVKAAWTASRHRNQLVLYLDVAPFYKSKFQVGGLWGSGLDSWVEWCGENHKYRWLRRCHHPPQTQRSSLCWNARPTSSESAPSLRPREKPVCHHPRSQIAHCHLWQQYQGPRTRAPNRSGQARLWGRRHSASPGWTAGPCDPKNQWESRSYFGSYP